MKFEDKIKKSLDKIRPALQSDGGDVQFVSWDDDKKIVKVQLIGMCAGCPMSQITLKQGVEAELKNEFPEIKAVENV